MNLILQQILFIIGSLFVAFAGGSFYILAAYSENLKNVLNIEQYQINFIGYEKTKKKNLKIKFFFCKIKKEHFLILVV